MLSVLLEMSYRACKHYTADINLLGEFDFYLGKLKGGFTS